MTEDPQPPLRIAIRFPWYASALWRKRLLASLASVRRVEITNLTPATPVEQVDLILDLSTEPLDSHQLRRAPRFGYWTFVYGAEPERIEPGLQEFVAGHRAAHMRLVRQSEPDVATVLREGTVKTITWSVKATRERILEAILDWPARLLQEMQHNAAPTAAPIPVRHRGTLSRLTLYSWLPLAWVRNFLTRLAREMTREHWAVGVIAQPVQQVCQSFDPESIRWLPAPPDGFLADPFGVSLPDGRLVILAEALSWREGRGRIVAFESNPDGSVTAMQDVLAFTGHASYPQLLELDGAIYCIPETSAQRRVQLFRAEPFPHRWVLDTILLDDFAGADATVHFHAGRWWLFAGNHDDQDEAKLFVFHASELRGPWLPHTANPVKCDLRSARPAGPPFTLAGELYRPAQDCSSTYGGAVVINKIEELTPHRFRERPVERLQPSTRGPCPDGLHTLSAAGAVTLVDGKRHAWSAAPLATRLGLLRRKVAERNS